MRCRTPASAVVLAALLSACSWNPLSWGGTPEQPCFFKQGGEAVGDCAAVRKPGDGGLLAGSLSAAGLALSDAGERIAFASVTSAKVAGAFNAIGDTAQLAQPRVFEPDVVPAQEVLDEEVVLTLPQQTSARPPLAVARQSSSSSGGSGSVHTAVGDRFTGIIRIVGKGVPTGAAVPVRSDVLAAMLVSGTEPPQRKFAIVDAATGTGSARMRSLLVRAGSGAGASTARSTASRGRDGDASSSLAASAVFTVPGDGDRSRASSVRANRLTAALSGDGKSSAKSTTSSSQASSAASEGDSTSSATSLRSSTSSRLSILDRLRGSRSSGATTRSSSTTSSSSRDGGGGDAGRDASSSRGSLTFGGGEGDDGWTPRGSLVSGSGDGGGDEYVPRGTLVSGDGTSGGDDGWTPRGTLIRGGGAPDEDTSFTPAQREHCPRNRSLLGAVLGDSNMTMGGRGWTFPGLINGDCPMGVGLLKINTEGSPFGSMDF